MKTASLRDEATRLAGTADGVLVDPEWLHAHLSDPRVRVVEVDVSPAAYNDWHIDGATLWNVYADLKDADYRLVDTAALERLVKSSGIEPDSTVVCYGYAPALGLWLMKLYGHRDVRILNCSRDTWRAGGHPWSTAASEPAPGGWRLVDEDSRIRANLAAVREAIGQPGITLVDVRSAAEYAGERFWPSGGMEPGGRAGHVPSAVHQPVDGIYREDGSFRPAAECATCSRRGAGWQRGADHLLHHRRARRHRLVRAHPPARPRASPRLRRVLGRMGPYARHSRRST